MNTKKFIKRKYADYLPEIGEWFSIKRALDWLYMLMDQRGKEGFPYRITAAYYIAHFYSAHPVPPEVWADSRFHRLMGDIFENESRFHPEWMN